MCHIQDICPQDAVPLQRSLERILEAVKQAPRLAEPASRCRPLVPIFRLGSSLADQTDPAVATFATCQASVEERLKVFDRRALSAFLGGFILKLFDGRTNGIERDGPDLNVCRVDQLFNSVRQRRHRVMSDVEPIQAQEFVAIAFQYLLTLYIRVTHVLVVVAGVDVLAVFEMKFETVVLNDDLHGPSALRRDAEQKIRFP